MRISRRELLQLAAVSAALPLAPGTSVAHPRLIEPLVPEVVPEKFRSLPFEAQRLGGLFGERMRINVEGRLLRIDQEALVSAFIGRAGKQDSLSFAGEHVGKFLDAACNAVRAQESAELRHIMDQAVRTLLAHQGADGYLGTYPEERRWSKAGWDVWVHKYNLIGLLSYWELTGDAATLAACRKMGDLLERTFGDAPGKRDLISAGLHTGMAATSVLEPMCKLYRCTNEPRYLEFCKYVVRSFEHSGGPRIVSALLDHGSVYRTGNGKAYEMLSTFLGMIDLYRITGEQSLFTAVMRAWEDIVRNQLYYTGSTSALEHFQKPGHLLTLHSSNVGEMCVTVTWMQLNWRLLRLTGEARFGQELERTIYNHLFAGQSARTGDISYYTAFCGHKEHVDFQLCCVSSGPRGISMIPQLAWGLADNAFVVNLISEGEARFEIDGVPVRVSVETRFPLDGAVAISVEPQRPIEFTLRIRVPEWAGNFVARMSGEVFPARAGQMLDIKQRWSRGKTLAIRMDLPVKLLPGYPGYSEYVAIQRGPQILALEKAVNAGVPYLSRAGLREVAAAAELKSVKPTAGWAGAQVYAVEGVATQLAGSEKPAPVTLKLVPFADALTYRIWVSKPDQIRPGVPPVTLDARARISADHVRLDPAEQLMDWDDITEYLTDENSATMCSVDPQTPDFMVWAGRAAPGKRGDPVWFALILDEPDVITRVLFRQGQIDGAGGWFDTSKRKPRIEVVRAVPPMWDRGAFVAVQYLHDFKWEPVADVEDYPITSATAAPGLASGQAFEVRLPQPMKIYALRIVGDAGGDRVSCAELGGHMEGLLALARIRAA